MRGSISKSQLWTIMHALTHRLSHHQYFRAHLQFSFLVQDNECSYTYVWLLLLRRPFFCCFATQIAHAQQLNFYKIQLLKIIIKLFLVLPATILLIHCPALSKKSSQLQIPVWCDVKDFFFYQPPHKIYFGSFTFCCLNQNWKAGNFPTSYHCVLGQESTWFSLSSTTKNLHTTHKLLRLFSTAPVSINDNNKLFHLLFSCVSTRLHANPPYLSLWLLSRWNVQVEAKLSDKQQELFLGRQFLLLFFLTCTLHLSWIAKKNFSSDFQVFFSFLYIFPSQWKYKKLHTKVYRGNLFVWPHTQLSSSRLCGEIKTLTIFN